MQGLNVLNLHLTFINTLPSTFQKDKFLPEEFKTQKLEECFVQLLVAEYLENKGMA